MNNREIFEVAEIEVIAFDAEDIIRTSKSEGENEIFSFRSSDGKIVLE